MFCFTVVCNAAATKCDDQLAPVLTLQPSLDTLARVPFLEWQLNNVNVTAAQHDALYLRSGVFARGKLTMDTFERLWDGLRAAPSKRNLVLFHVGGGAIAKVGADETAFPHRECVVVLQIKAIWNLSAEASANMAWVRRVHASVASNLSGAYVNYIDPEQQDWERAYYGDNYPRLQRAKAAFDPTNFFQFRQSIRLPEERVGASGTPTASVGTRGVGVVGGSHTGGGNQGPDAHDEVGSERSK